MGLLRSSLCVAGIQGHTSVILSPHLYTWAWKAHMCLEPSSSPSLTAQSCLPRSQSTWTPLLSCIESLHRSLPVSFQPKAHALNTYLCLPHGLREASSGARLSEAYIWERMMLLASWALNGRHPIRSIQLQLGPALTVGSSVCWES